MANTQAMTTSFKTELLTAVHNFGIAPTRVTSAADSFKAALYLASASLGAGTTVYSVTGEVSGAGYTAGGVAVTNAIAPTFSGTTAYWTSSASIVYTSVTLAVAFDAVLIYNATQGDKAVSVHTFSSQTITAGTFTLTMPVNDASNALIRLA